MEFLKPVQKNELNIELIYSNIDAFLYFPFNEGCWEALKY